MMILFLCDKGGSQTHHAMAYQIACHLNLQLIDSLWIRNLQRD
jgi:hypothetical protein